MPVSGLVVNFDSAVTHHAATIDTIKAIPEVETGEAQGGRLAIVVDTASRSRDQEIWQMIEGLPGVVDLAIAFVGFEDEGDVVECDEDTLPKREQ